MIEEAWAIAIRLGLPVAVLFGIGYLIQCRHQQKPSVAQSNAEPIAQPQQRQEKEDLLMAKHNALMVERASDRDGFLEEVCSVPGGNSVRWCVQCGMCAASCPNVSRMDYSPRKTIALIRAGRRYEVLTSNSMWLCASCYLCTVRCPRGVKPTELMHALECLAVRHGLSNRRVSTPAMYTAFVNSINSNGRIHELGFMSRFYLKTFFSNLRTNPMAAVKMVSLVKITPMGLALLRHGRLPLRAKKIKETKRLNTIIKKARALGGAE